MQLCPTFRQREREREKETWWRQHQDDIEYIGCAENEIYVYGWMDGWMNGLKKKFNWTHSKHIQNDVDV